MLGSLQAVTKLPGRMIDRAFCIFLNASLLSRNKADFEVWSKVLFNGVVSQDDPALLT